MLELIEEKDEKAKYQEKLHEKIIEFSTSDKDGGVATRGGDMDATLYLADNNRIWYAHYTTAEPGTIDRYWNGFGIYNNTKKLQNVRVEINIPTKSNTGQVAGFFAKRKSTGEIFLMHSGKIGGGGKGVGKEKFLGSIQKKTHDVIDANEDTRIGLIVCGLTSPTIQQDIVAFVDTVIKFKEDAKAGKFK